MADEDEDEDKDELGELEDTGRTSLRVHPTGVGGIGMNAASSATVLRRASSPSAIKSARSCSFRDLRTSDRQKQRTSQQAAVRGVVQVAPHGKEVVAVPIVLSAGHREVDVQNLVPPAGRYEHEVSRILRELNRLGVERWLRGLVTEEWNVLLQIPEINTNTTT